MSEDPYSTWTKKYTQNHYSYRDYATLTTLILTEAQATALALQQSPLTYYAFETNARAKLNLLTGLPYGLANWPANCYARDILFLCDQNAWVSIISVNSEYVRQAVLQAFAKVLPTASPTIIECEMYIPANQFMRFHPTLGLALIFRADTVGGILRVWSEGNVEGGE